MTTEPDKDLPRDSDAYHGIIRAALLSPMAPNLMLYGDKGTSKLNMILEHLNLSYDKFNVHDGPFRWLSYGGTKIFDMNMISNKNSRHFFGILNDAIESKIFWSTAFHKVIILNKFNHLSSHIQSKLRVIIEKKRTTSLFIILTDKFTSIIEPIKSRSLCVRIPRTTNIAKRQKLRKELSNISYDRRSVIYDKIYKAHDNDISYYSSFNEGIPSHMTIYEKIYVKLINLADVADVADVRVGTSIPSLISKSDIIHVRDMAYNIEKYNLYDIHRELLCLFIEDPRFTVKKTVLVVDQIADMEYKYIKSYRSLIHVEELLLNFIYLSANKEIYRHDEE